mgnify:CR=1 FL=1
MADRVDFYFRQRVTEAELDLAFALLEKADRDLAADLNIYGVIAGAVPSPHAPVPDLTVDAAGVLDLGQSAEAVRFTHVAGAGTVTNGAFTVAGSLSAGDTPGEAGVFQAETLVFENGVTLHLDWSETANDLFAVSGALTGAAGGIIDFGRAEGDAIPVPMTAVIGTYGTFSGSFSGWKVRNAGLPPRVGLSARITAEDGVVTLSVANSGLIMLLR